MSESDPTLQMPQAEEIFGPLSSVQLTTRPVLDALLEEAGLHKVTGASPAEDLRDVLDRLKGIVIAAHLDEVDRATLSKIVLDTLAERKIKNARPLVKAALGDLAPGANGHGSTSAANAITLTDDEPAADPTDGAALLDQTSRLIRRHVVLSQLQADAIALWVMAAYVIDALVLMPILLVTAPTMRSGKSTLLTLLAAIVRRALVASNLTGAVLARAIAAFRPTLLADEADTWLTDEAFELRGIMNAGHTRPTAYILRCAPESHEPQLIPCFGARVISMIKRPPSTIADRSILIDLRRKRADEAVSRLRVDRLYQEHLSLRRAYRRWADDHLDAVRQADDPSVPTELHDRAADNWRPLLVLADVVGGDWPARARVAATKLSAQDDPEDSIAVELLADIRTIFVDRSGRWMTSAELTAALVAMPERPWAEWSGGRPMTAVKLAARLKPFGLRPQKVRDGTRTVNAYVLADFTDAWARYLPIDSEQSEQPKVSGPCSDFSESEQNMNVPTPKTRNNSMFSASVPTVPTSIPDLSEKKSEDAMLMTFDLWGDDADGHGDGSRGSTAGGRSQSHSGPTDKTGKVTQEDAWLDF